MGNFMGGSAYAMAQQIGSGVLLVAEKTFGRLVRPELDTLAFELDRLLREVRGDQPAGDDLVAIKDRQRRMQRLTSSLVMLQSFRQRRKL
jgi:type IV secretory pathway TraG/TraD family ATPase VirD4